MLYPDDAKVAAASPTHAPRVFADVRRSRCSAGEARRGISTGALIAPFVFHGSGI
jgi:hypothetical protein